MKNFIAIVFALFFCLSADASDYFRSLKSLDVYGVNVKNTGSTLIGTTENGTESFHPLFVVIVMNAATSLTIAGAASIGTNSASYNNIVPITTLTGLTTASQMLPISIATAIAKIAVNTGVYVNITTGATGTSGTIDVHVIGFYQ